MACIQLTRTLPRVPEDLFYLKKENREMRLSRMSKPQSKSILYVALLPCLHQKPETKRQADLMTHPDSTSLILSCSKRLRLMTARMSTSDVQLQTLRQSLARALMAVS